MIPKIIHYCWFGDGKFSDIQEICFASWKKYLPDYEFILWNESNSDLEHPFVKFAYQKKKFAFVADYVRLKAVYNSGGIYLDTDMFLVDNFETLLDQTFFIGAQDDKLINGSIFGAVKKDNYIKECLTFYDQKPEDWQLRLAIPRILTRTFEAYTNCSNVVFNAIVKEKNMTIYPQEYFYPLSYDVNKPFKKDFLKYATDKTLAIHLWEGSWIEYDIFQLIRRKNYLQALRKINFNKKLNIGFLRKCVIAIFQSIKN